MTIINTLPSACRHSAAAPKPQPMNRNGYSGSTCRSPAAAGVVSARRKYNNGGSDRQAAVQVRPNGGIGLTAPTPVSEARRRAAYSGEEPGSSAYLRPGVGGGSIKLRPRNQLDNRTTALMA